MKTVTALVAAFAAATSAFLVAPTIPGDFKDTRFPGDASEYVKEFIHTLLEQKPTIIDLACPGCPVAVEQRHEEIIWENDIENVIRLEFTTRGQTFSLNNHPLLPFEKAQRARSTVVKAHQIRKDTNKASADVPLNFAMEIMPIIKSAHKDEAAIIPVEFTVLSLSGVPVKVNTISLKLVQTPSKELVIVSHEEVPFEETPGADTCDETQPWSLCRLRAIVMARVKFMLDATKQKADTVNGWVKGHCSKGRRPHKSEGDRPHKPHHHKNPHRYHRVGHMLHQTFRFFIIPALLGVIGGLAASAIGMLIGQLIVLIWVKAYRRGRRGPIRHTQQVLIIESDEKDELLLHGEAPPQYEDAPEYDVMVQRDVEIDAVEDGYEK